MYMFLVLPVLLLVGVLVVFLPVVPVVLVALIGVLLYRVAVRDHLPHGLNRH